jgi:hypothetical protein
MPPVLSMKKPNKQAVSLNDVTQLCWQLKAMQQRLELELIAKSVACYDISPFNVAGVAWLLPSVHW